MSDKMDLTDEEASEKYSQQEWDDYQEHLKSVGTVFHARTFIHLGFIAGRKAPSVLALKKDYDELKKQAEAKDEELKRLKRYVISGYELMFEEIKKIIDELQQKLTLATTTLEFYSKTSSFKITPSLIECIQEVYGPKTIGSVGVLAAETLVKLKAEPSVDLDKKTT